MFSNLIDRRAPAVQTHAVVSMRNKLFAVNPKDENVFLGAISRFEPNQGRSVEAVKGIGAGDVNLELVPNFSDTYTFRVETTMFYMRNLMQVFGYHAGTEGLVRALRHHKYPFDIKQELVFSEVADLEQKSSFTFKSSEGFQCLLTWYEACWMTSYSHGFATDTSRVVESADISVTDIVPGFGNVEPNDETGNSVKKSLGLTAWYKPLPGVATA